MTTFFSKRLELVRERAGLKQYELGLRAGIEDEYKASTKINQYEQGVHISKFPRLKDLALALNVPTAYFYAEEEDVAEWLYQYKRVVG